jgi:hypothetical protein
LKSFVIHPIAFAGAHGCALGEAWITVKHFLGIKKEGKRLVFPSGQVVSGGRR